MSSQDRKRTMKGMLADLDRSRSALDELRNVLETLASSAQEVFDDADEAASSMEENGFVNKAEELREKFQAFEDVTVAPGFDEIEEFLSNVEGALDGAA